MGAIFFGLFSLSAVVTIVSTIFEKPRIRIVSKVCLMPLLILFTIFQSNGFPILILLALLCAWAGDILLIKPKKMQLYLGIGGFIISHILYIITYTNFIDSIHILFGILSLLIVLLSECFIIKKLRFPKDYLIPILVYGTIIGLLIVFSLQVFIDNKDRYGFLLVAGSISFLISDTVLAYYNTVKTMTRQALSFVMTTYVIAQAGIVIACIQERINP
jgi:uncharacterized membrane protein YhhN